MLHMLPFSHGAQFAPVFAPGTEIRRETRVRVSPAHNHDCEFLLALFKASVVSKSATWVRGTEWGRSAREMEEENAGGGVEGAVPGAIVPSVSCWRGRTEKTGELQCITCLCLFSVICSRVQDVHSGKCVCIYTPTTPTTPTMSVILHLLPPPCLPASTVCPLQI